MINLKLRNGVLHSDRKNIPMIKSPFPFKTYWEIDNQRHVIAHYILRTSKTFESFARQAKQTASSGLKLVMIHLSVYMTFRHHKKEKRLNRCPISGIHTNLFAWYIKKVYYRHKTINILDNARQIAFSLVSGGYLKRNVILTKTSGYMTSPTSKWCIIITGLSKEKETHCWNSGWSLTPGFSYWNVKNIAQIS